jgi:hypothetical protein
MTTTKLGRRALRRRIIAAIPLAAAATVVGLVAPVAPANAADTYISLSIGYNNPNPPVTVVGGSAIGGDKEQARVQALSDCANNGGGNCETEVLGTNTCGAAATNSYGERVGAEGATVAAAEASAKSKLSNQQGAYIVVSGCSNGAPPPGPGQPPPPSGGGNQPTPPTPLSPPTVTWDSIVGGFVAHIADHSGVASKCTYKSDNVNRSFDLAANSTYDLKVVPAVPLNRDYTVTVTCDNGTTTTATHHF